MGHPWHRGVASNDNLDRTELDDFHKQLQEGGRVEIVEGLADKPVGVSAALLTIQSCQSI